MTDGPAPPAETVAPTVRALARGHRPDWTLVSSEVAAAHIVAWHKTLQAISATAEAEVMAACWAIRREHPDREEFAAFVTMRLEGVMTPGRAWTAAETWELARKHRPIRELTATAPREAIQFVRDFTAAAEQAPLPLDDDDRTIAGLLAEPPKRRREKLREMAAAARAAGEHRHPDDITRIAELERAQTEAANREAADPLRSATAAVDALAAVERDLDGAARELDLLLARGAVTGRLQERVTHLSDRLMARLEELADAVREAREGES